MDVAASSETENACGDCGMCCKLLGIETLGKPAGPQCDHFKGGCQIYDDRPFECRAFHCAWLKSQRLPPALRMAPEWRPDRANFVMYTEQSGMRLNVVVEPTDPDAWRRAPYHAYIKRMSQRAAEGHELVVFLDDRRMVVFPDEEVDLGPVKPGQDIVFGRTERDGRMVPYARIVTPSAA
jgi:hypothetical protein